MAPKKTGAKPPTVISNLRRPARAVAHDEGIRVRGGKAAKEKKVEEK
jgi:hypothetical protein